MHKHFSTLLESSEKRSYVIFDPLFNRSLSYGILGFDYGKVLFGNTKIFSKEKKSNCVITHSLKGNTLNKLHYYEK